MMIKKCFMWNIKLLELSPIIRKIIINKNIEVDIVRELLNIENENDQFRVLKEICGNN